MNIKDYFKKKKIVIDAALDRYLPLPDVKPQIIHKAMRYAVFPGGKRIRPILTLVGFEALGGRANSIMPIACGIELVHCYTLVHDDLPCMDNDDYRRGKLTCHKKFGEDIALLAGDALLTLGFEICSKPGNVTVVEEIAKSVGSLGTIGGQVADIQEKRAKDLYYITLNKTGKLFEVALKCAGIFGGVGEKKLKALSDFGMSVGFIFQLTDDLIDRDGYVEVYGKDYVEKKINFLTHKTKGYLRIFGSKATVLSEILDLIAKRRS